MKKKKNTRKCENVNFQFGGKERGKKDGRWRQERGG